ncbi:MAG: hypothetical protein SGI87_10460 [Flavobacteriales bacterium]|nr:hypothetical protein [Flavobacteriales bacterium]
MKLKYFSIFVLFLLAFPALGQRSKCPVVPDEYSWNSASDYSMDSSLVAECLVWLCNAALYDRMECRSEVNLFVMEWLAGSPSVKIDVDSKLLPFTEENPELLFSYIHGMALYQLKNRRNDDLVKSRIEGLKAVSQLVEREEDMKKSKDVRKLLRMAKSDKKLNNYYHKQVLLNA